MENPCSNWADMWVPNSNLPSREPANPEDGEIAFAAWKRSLEDTIGKRWSSMQSAQLGPEL